MVLLLLIFMIFVTLSLLCHPYSCMLCLFSLGRGCFVGLLCFAKEFCKATITWAFCYSHCILVLYQSSWSCSIGGRDEWKPLAVFQVTLCFPWYKINVVLGFLHLYNTVCLFFFYTMACCCCFSFSPECCRCSSILSLFSSSELAERGSHMSLA